MPIERRQITSILFAISAVGPLGVWYILLFVAIPESQEPVVYALSTASYVLTEPESQWFFVLLLLTPLLSLALSFVSWRRMHAQSGATKWLQSFAVIATVLLAAVCWPAAIFSAQATYYVFRAGGG